MPGVERVDRPNLRTRAPPEPDCRGRAPEFDVGAGFDCGYLTVAENRERPSGRTIRIPVARLRAQSPNPKPDPIVFLAGGPGSSGLPEQSAASGRNAKRDVIFISQHGTLKADPFLSCPEIDELTARSAHLVIADRRRPRPARPRPAGAETDTPARVGPCRPTTRPKTAADVADLRTALGIDKWNVYGVSYGTNLALQLRDHPEGIRAMVLDGVVPPQIRSVEVDWAAAAAGYQALFDACAREPECHRACPHVRDKFTMLVSALTQRPRTIAVPDSGHPVNVIVDDHRLANLVVHASSHPELRAEIPLIVHDLATADGVKAARALLCPAGRSDCSGTGCSSACNAASTYR
jgi:pimeloyl-ACP methyl ester carboxylesterase